MTMTFNVNAAKVICTSNNQGICDLFLRDGHEIKCPGMCSLFTPVNVAASTALAG